MRPIPQSPSAAGHGCSSYCHPLLLVCSLFPHPRFQGTCGLVAMTSASHGEGRQFDPGQVYREIACASTLRRFKTMFESRRVPLAVLGNVCKTVSPRERHPFTRVSEGTVKFVLELNLAKQNWNIKTTTLCTAMLCRHICTPLRGNMRNITFQRAETNAMRKYAHSLCK